MVITAGNLAVGDIIADGKDTIQVTKLGPCTQPRKIHVNGSNCYDNIAVIEILREDKHSDGCYAVLRHESRRVQSRMV